MMLRSWQNGKPSQISPLHFESGKCFCFHQDERCSFHLCNHRDGSTTLQVRGEICIWFGQISATITHRLPQALWVSRPRQSPWPSPFPNEPHLFFIPSLSPTGVNTPTVLLILILILILTDPGGVEVICFVTLETERFILKESLCTSFVIVKSSLPSTSSRTTTSITIMILQEVL